MVRLHQMTRLGVRVEIRRTAQDTDDVHAAFRWNHAWAIARAVEGLEPYARARAATN